MRRVKLSSEHFKINKFEVDKKIMFLIIFGILIFSLRSFNLNEAIFDDEANSAYSVSVMDKWGINQDYPSSQLHNLIYKPFIFLFGLKIWVFRLVPLLFGILNIVLVYFFSKRNFGKRVAFFSVIVMLISFYHTLASLQFDIEGNLIMTLFILLFYSLIEFYNSKKKYWMFFTGFFLGVLINNKYNAIFVVFIILAYVVFRNFKKERWIKKSICELFLIYFIGLVFFVFLIIVNMLLSTKMNNNSVHLFSWFDGFINAYRPNNFSILGLSMFLLWSTPLLFGFYIISLVKRNKELFLFIFWVSFNLIFYSFGITYGSFDRYLMNTIPALSIIAGFYLSKINFSKFHIKFGAFVFIFYSLFLFYLNLRPAKFLSRNIGLYIKELFSLNFDFIFVFTSASGPTFGVNFLTILVSFSLALFFLFLSMNFIKRNIRIFNLFFVIFLVISVSFNSFLVFEYLIHPTGNDVSEIKYQMMDYVNKNGLAEPIYSNDSGIIWFYNNLYWRYKNNINSNVFGLPDNEINARGKVARKSISVNGGTVILLNWPKIPQNSPVWDIISSCSLDKNFYSRNLVLGQVFVC